MLSASDTALREVAAVAHDPSGYFENVAFVEDLLADAKASLDRSPGTNWVERVGGLPDYIRRIAQHIINKGSSVSHAIAIAINVVKKACATGDLNWPGLQQENASSRAEACAAVASWEAKKAAAHAS